MSYMVKEIYHTLQGEGVRTGTAAVFLRFAGCNLWSGREEDRADAQCRFCDTDFRGGTRYELDALVDAVHRFGTVEDDNRWVAITGGEPLLQLDADLVDGLHLAGYRIALETNGTIALDIPHIDWVTVSPKAGPIWRQRSGHELKLVYPQPGLLPDAFGLANFTRFDHYCLQPMDGPDLAANTRAAIEYCMNNPRWRLSLQTHKMTGIR